MNTAGRRVQIAGGAFTVLALGLAIRPEVHARPDGAEWTQGGFAMAATGTATEGPAQPGVGTLAVEYAAGWNLVGGPAQSSFPVPLFAWDPSAGQYRTLPAGTPVTRGQGYWAYFGQPATVQLLDTGGPLTSLTLPVPAGEWIQVANPGNTSVTVSGVDLVAVYDTASGNYHQTSMLGVGQGAWVYSASGGSVRLLGARLQ